MQIETLNESRCWDFPAGQDFEKYHRSFDEVASTEMLLNEFLFFSEESDFCQEKKKKTCCNQTFILVILQVLPGGVLQQIGSFRHNSQKHGE